jgi:hypothetical protein
MSFGTIIRNSGGNDVINNEHKNLVIDNGTLNTLTLISNGVYPNPWYYGNISIGAQQDILVEMLAGSDTLSLHRNGSNIRVESPSARTIKYYKYELSQPSVSGTNPHGLAVKNDADELTFSSTSSLISMKNTFPQYNYGAVNVITTSGPLTMDSNANWMSFGTMPAQPIRLNNFITFFIGTGVKRLTSTTYEITTDIFGVLDIPVGGSSIYFGTTSGFTAKIT